MWLKAKDGGVGWKVFTDYQPPGLSVPFNLQTRFLVDPQFTDAGWPEEVPRVTGVYSLAILERGGKITSVVTDSYLRFRVRTHQSWGVRLHACIPILEK